MSSKVIFNASIPVRAQSVNSYYRTRKVFISPKGREYQRQVWEHIPTLHVQTKKPLSLKVDFQFGPPNRRRDLDNYFKVLIDCMKTRLFADDSQIKEIHATIQNGDTDKIQILVEERQDTITEPEDDIIDLTKPQ
jgi:Holliday junction resolvase RusA-like endonuclease